MYIFSIVINYSGISLEDIKSNSRKAEIVTARSIVVYILRMEMGITFMEIAKILNKETSSISRSFRVFLNRMMIDIILKKDVNTAIKQLRELENII